MKKLVVLLLWLAFSAAVFAQNKPLNFFQAVQQQDIPAFPDLAQRSFPTAYTTWRLDLPALKQALTAAPQEFSPAARAQEFVLSLPNASGALEAFEIWEIDILHPELAARHPYIKTYAGASVNNPGAVVRLSVTARGVHTMVIRPGGMRECVDPYSYNQTEYYLAYDAQSAPVTEAQKAQRLAEPGSEPLPDFTPYAPAAEERGTLLNPVGMKLYRFAASAIGEFSQDHGGTLASVLSAVAEYTNDISAVYEMDISIRLQLVPNNDEIIFLDPNTDPYTGNAAPNWASQNSLIVNTAIGSANFDIGHVFCRYMGGGIGGIGGLGVVCSSTKSYGATTGNGNGSYGPGFVSTLGQEIGHQFGGGHSWNRCNNISGRNGSTAYEPGSGSTIMSYAGSCGSDNVQFYSDLYFHAGSIEEIGYYALFGNPSQCGTIIPTANNAPVVTLPYQDNFFIPILTPFELNGSATDADGDPLTFSWEEMDTGPEVPLETPTGTSPLFRTWPAVAATNRVFPRMSTILNNQFDLSEQLPTYTRDLNFRLTARDNQSGGGGIHWADVSFKATELAGPFVVTAPNVPGTVWSIGSYMPVSWDVANTHLYPVNCHTVNILLSTDNGQTWPHVLASNTANDGIQYVLAPNLPTNNARIRVQAADNIFFDVSDTKFIIKQPTQPGFSVSLSNDATQVCLPSDYNTDILTSTVLGFNTPVQIFVEGDLPPGASYAFGATTIQPGESTSFSLDMSNVTQAGDYSFLLRAFATGGDTLDRQVSLHVVSNDFSAMALQSPADGSTGLLQTQILRWSTAPDAITYDLQLANNPSFSPASILATKTATVVDTFKIPFLLEKGKVYYWRVRPVNECGAHDWLETNSFATLVDNCQVWAANDLPLTITANGSSTVESDIFVGADAIISDINVEQVSGFHDEFGQLEVSLISPSGTTVSLFKNKCGVISVPFNIALDDNSPNVFSCPPSNSGTAVKPQTPLAPLVGQNAQGVWTLRVKDPVTGAGGAVQGFQLEICSSVSLNAPFLVNNNALSIESGLNAPITTDLLKTEDADNAPSELVYTLVTAPHLGHLEKNWGGIMQPGDQFTQADLDNGAIRYFDYGGDLDQDYFRFTVTDSDGGYFGTPKFIIQPFSLGANSPDKTTLAFQVYPNPAQEQVWIAFSRSDLSETRVSIYDASGKMLLTQHLADGQDRAAFDVHQLPPGWYVIRVENARYAGVRPLMIARQ